MTTHSPVAVRELGGDQLVIIRPEVDGHVLKIAGTDNGIQGTMRLYPDAFLATSVIACEGASEVGLIRGLDQYLTAKGRSSISAQGTALVDCHGGDPDEFVRRASAFRALGYRAAVFRDDDKPPTPETEAAFVKEGGAVIAWRDGRALEDELFLSLSDKGVGNMVERAVELHGEDLVDEHIKSASQNTKDLAAIRSEIQAGSVAVKSRETLAIAAKSKRNQWYKKVTWMEDLARDVVGPDMPKADGGFRELINKIFLWAIDGQQSH